MNTKTIDVGYCIFHIAENGLKKNSEKEVLHPATAINGLTKSEKRKLRRGLDAFGRHDLSSKTFANATAGFSWTEKSK